MSRELDSSPPEQAGGASPSKTIFLVCEDPPRRNSLAAKLTGMKFTVVEHESLDEFFARRDGVASGCVVIDSRSASPVISLYERWKSPPRVPPVIFIGDEEDVSTIVKLVRAGTSDVLSRRAAGDTEIWEAIQQALVDGEAKRTAFQQAEHRRARMATLTPPERQVLAALLEGRNNREIAESLGITRFAVEGRRTRIMRKLGVTTFPALVRFAITAEADGEA